MENELEKTSKLKFLLESIVKIVANGHHRFSFPLV